MYDAGSRFPPVQATYYNIPIHIPCVHSMQMWTNCSKRSVVGGAFTTSDFIPGAAAVGIYASGYIYAIHLQQWEIPIHARDCVCVSIRRRARAHTHTTGEKDEKIKKEETWYIIYVYICISRM